MSEELVGEGGVADVLGRFECVDRQARVTSGRLGLVADGVQPRLGPPEAGPVERIAGLFRERERVAEELFSTAEIPAVEDDVGEERREAKRRQWVFSRACICKLPFPDPDCRFVFAEDHVRAAEPIGGSNGMIGRQHP